MSQQQQQFIVSFLEYNFIFEKIDESKNITNGDIISIFYTYWYKSLYFNYVDEEYIDIIDFLSEKYNIKLTNNDLDYINKKLINFDEFSGEDITKMILYLKNFLIQTQNFD